MNMARKGLTRFKTILCENCDKKCHYCGVKLVFGKKQKSFNFATVDHVQPKSLGGEDALSNFVLACMGCNSLRGNMSYEKYCKLVSSVEDRDNYFNSIKNKTKAKKEKRQEETLRKLIMFFVFTHIKLDFAEDHVIIC